MPVVTISRQMGSRGDEIASAVADRLGYRLVDRNTLAADASRYAAAVNASAGAISALEKASFWDHFSEERRRYSTLLKALIYSYAQEDRVVLLGRGAEVLLRNVAHALKAKVIAPFNVRVQRVAEEKGVSRQEATNLVWKSDRERSGHVEYLFHGDWADPDTYDVILNTCRVDVVTATDTLERMLESPAFHPTRASQEMVADLALASRVEVHLALHPGIHAASFEVVARSGEVVVTGLVSSAAERQLALETIHTVAADRLKKCDITVAQRGPER